MERNTCSQPFQSGLSTTAILVSSVSPHNNRLGASLHQAHVSGTVVFCMWNLTWKSCHRHSTDPPLLQLFPRLLYFRWHLSESHIVLSQSQCHDFFDKCFTDATDCVMVQYEGASALVVSKSLFCLSISCSATPKSWVLSVTSTVELLATEVEAHPTLMTTHRFL